MADFNPLQAPSYTELMRRLLGEDLRLDSVSPELGLALVLENDRPEWHYLKGQTRYSSGLQITATPAAGLFSAVELRNPALSTAGQQQGGVIAIVEAVYLAPLFIGANSYVAGLDAGALGGGVGNGLFLDTREVSTKKSVCELRITATAGAVVVPDGSAIDVQQTGAGTEENVGFLALNRLILAPSHRLTIASRVAAILTAVVFLWREKRVRPEELVL